MEELYTITQIAKILKVHHLTVRRYIRLGKLQALRIAGNVRVTIDALEDFSKSFVPETKTDIPNSHSQQVKPFLLSDPLFKLQGKGVKEYGH